MRVRLKVVTYSCFSDVTFPEFVEVDEKLLDPNSVLGDQSLDSFLNVLLDVHEGGLPLLS